MTPDEACINYAIAAASVRELSAAIRKGLCERTVKYVHECEKGNPQVYECPKECLADKFAGDEIDSMCAVCENRFDLVRKRKLARGRLGQAKRAVFAVGKRLNKPCGEAERKA
jgi:hypothetical protein